jgi:hypothetical protein
VQRLRSGVIRTIALGPSEPAAVEERDRLEMRPRRRFAPPVTAAPGRPSDVLPAATQEARDE